MALIDKGDLVREASVAYMGSLVLIRHRLSDAQAVPEKPTVDITTDVGPVDPRISVPTVMTSSQTPSALESGYVEDNATTANAHPSPIPFTRIFYTTATGARSSLLSAIAESLAAHLHHPAGLDMGMRRVSLFNLSVVVPCVRASAGDADSDHDADAQKDAVALALFLNKCHGVCSCFVLVGFALVVIGVVASLWKQLELSVAIFGSACIALCLVLGLGALR